MLKKAFATAAALAVLFLSCSADASPDEREIYGTIASVASAKNQVSVTGDDGKTYQFMVNPATDIEIKRKYWFDTDGDLNDLKKGDWVKIEYKMTSPTYFVAKDIEIYRGK